MFTVYIIYSKNLDKFYIGFTGDSVEARLQKHLANHDGFTDKAKDWVIVLTELFKTKSNALAREKQIKAWKSKKRILDLIKRSSTQ